MPSEVAAKALLNCKAVPACHAGGVTPRPRLPDASMRRRSALAARSYMFQQFAATPMPAPNLKFAKLVFVCTPESLVAEPSAKIVGYDAET